MSIRTLGPTSSRSGIQMDTMSRSARLLWPDDPFEITHPLELMLGDALA